MPHLEIKADGNTDDTAALLAAIENRPIFYDGKLHVPDEDISLSGVMHLPCEVLAISEDDPIPELLPEPFRVARVPLYSRRKVVVHPKQQWTTGLDTEIDEERAMLP